MSLYSERERVAEDLYHELVILSHAMKTVPNDLKELEKWEEQNKHNCLTIIHNCFDHFDRLYKQLE